jgi:hypothetical protein
VILSFRAAPGTSLLVTATGMVIPVTGSQKTIAAPAPLSFTVTGTELYGTVTKPPIPGWLPCVNGGTNGFLIPGVTITKNMEIPGTCPPGIVNTSQLFFDGIYSFPNNVPSFEYRLTSGKSANGTDTCCGITGNDVYLTSQHILGLNCLPLGQVMAADYSADGKVTTFDIILMNRCISGNPDPVGPEWRPWRFVPFSNINDPAYDPLGFTYPSSLNDLVDYLFVTPLTAGTSIPGGDFWGVKRGDVDGDCQLCGNNFTGDTEDRNAGNSELVPVYLPQNSLDAGREILIPVRTVAAPDFFVLGMKLIFDADKFEVISIEYGDLTEADKYAAGSISAEENGTAVKYTWFDTHAEGAGIDENGVLFYVRIRAKENIENISEYIRQIANDPVNYLFFASDKTVDNKKKFVLHTSTNKENIFSAEILGSNIVSSEFPVLVKTHQPESLKITISDLRGLVVNNQTYVL